MDDADVERTPFEGRTLQHLHNRPDRVGLTEVVTKPQLVQPLVAVAFEEGDPGNAAARHLGTTAINEGAQVVYQNDSPKLAAVHGTIVPPLVGRSEGPGTITSDIGRILLPLTKRGVRDALVTVHTQRRVACSVPQGGRPCARQAVPAGLWLSVQAAYPSVRVDWVPPSTRGWIPISGRCTVYS